MSESDSGRSLEYGHYGQEALDDDAVHCTAGHETRGCVVGFPPRPHPEWTARAWKYDRLRTAAPVTPQDDGEWSREMRDRLLGEIQAQRALEEQIRTGHTFGPRTVREEWEARWRDAHPGPNP